MSSLSNNQLNYHNNDGGFCKPPICQLESFFGTLTRNKKDSNEVEELEKEGKDAIDGSTENPTIDSDTANDYQLQEYEERSMIEPSQLENNQFKSLLELLKNWINDELSGQRIYVRNLAEDLFDGQILGKLVEKLSGQSLDIIEVTQNEDLQKYKLRVVLETINRQLSIQSRWSLPKWTVAGIHRKCLIELVHLLVALIRFYRAPVRLPENVHVQVVVVQKRDSQLHSRIVTEQLTGVYDQLGQRPESRDAFDAIYEQSGEQLMTFKRSLNSFVNRHLNRINIELYSTNGIDLDPQQFSDGLLLCFLMGMLEGYFIPLGQLFTNAVEPEIEAASIRVNQKETALQPENYINTSPLHKLHNVNVAFQLIEDAGITLSGKIRAEDIVIADMKSLLRLLYIIFNKYKHL